MANFIGGDFPEIKQNLITFFEGQQEFQEFNFAGRRIDVLMDLLAFGDTFAQKYSSSLYGEAFIQRARLRSSVVLHAQQKYFYEPRSIKASQVTLDCIFTDDLNRTSITIPRGSIFEGSNVRGSFSFVLQEDVVAVRDSNNEYHVSLTLHQGDIINRQRSIDENRDILLRSENADRDTITLSINGVEWDREEHSARVLPGDQVFYTREDSDGNTVIYFGLGEDNGQVIQEFGGLRPDVGDTTVISYVETIGPDANGCTNFDLKSGPDGDISLQSIENQSTAKSFGGDDPESMTSIAFNAPRWRRADGRCVSPSDYDAHVQRVFGNIIETAQTWTDPNNTGFAFISAKAFDSFGTPTEVKIDIENYLSELNVSTIRPVVINPTKILLRHNIDADYTLGGTPESEIKSKIINSIDSYYSNSVSIFGGSFHNSRMLAAVDGSDNAIKGSSSENSLIIDYRDEADQTIVELTFANQVTADTMESTKFTYKSDEYEDQLETQRIEYDIYFRDDGNGDLLLGPFSSNESSITAPIVENTAEGDWYSVGTIDYSSGELSYSFYELGSNLRDRIPVATIEFEANTTEDDIYAPTGTLILFDYSLRPDLLNINLNAKSDNV